jgi:hypothetical protein
LKEYFFGKLGCSPKNFTKAAKILLTKRICILIPTWGKSDLSQFYFLHTDNVPYRYVRKSFSIISHSFSVAKRFNEYRVIGKGEITGTCLQRGNVSGLLSNFFFTAPCYISLNLNLIGILGEVMFCVILTKDYLMNHKIKYR